MQVGVNFADVFTCLGLYAAAPKEDVTPGLEVCHTHVLTFAAINMQHTPTQPAHTTPTVQYLPSVHNNAQLTDSFKKTQPFICNV